MTAESQQPGELTQLGSTLDSLPMLVGPKPQWTGLDELLSTQRTVSPSFFNGMTLDEGAKKMSTFGFDFFDPVHAVHTPDGLSSIDHRRLKAAEMAGLDKVRVFPHQGGDLLALDEQKRFTTKKTTPDTWLDAVEGRTGKQGKNFPKYGSTSLPNVKGKPKPPMSFFDKVKANATGVKNVLKGKAYDFMEGVANSKLGKTVGSASKAVANSKLGKLGGKALASPAGKWIGKNLGKALPVAGWGFDAYATGASGKEFYDTLQDPNASTAYKAWRGLHTVTQAAGFVPVVGDLVSLGGDVLDIGARWLENGGWDRTKDWVGEKAGQLWEGTKNVVGKVGDGLGAAYDWGKAKFGEGLDKAKEGAKWLGGKAKDGAEWAYDKFSKGAGWAGKKIGSVAKGVTGALKKGWSKLKFW